MNCPYTLSVKLIFKNLLDKGKALCYTYENFSRQVNTMLRQFVPMHNEMSVALKEVGLFALCSSGF